jgi:hypothetical protein
MTDTPATFEKWEPAEEDIRADLDPGIRDAVILLRDHGVLTGSSCQGGPGHAYPHPVIYFGGGDHSGLRAVWLLEGSGFHVSELVRIWDLNAGSFVKWRVDLEISMPPVSPIEGT